MFSNGLPSSFFCSSPSTLLPLSSSSSHFSFLSFSFYMHYSSLPLSFAHPLPPPATFLFCSSPFTVPPSLLSPPLLPFSSPSSFPFFLLHVLFLPSSLPCSYLPLSTSPSASLSLTCRKSWVIVFFLVSKVPLAFPSQTLTC